MPLCMKSPKVVCFNSQGQCEANKQACTVHTDWTGVMNSNYAGSNSLVRPGHQPDRSIFNCVVQDEAFVAARN